MILPETIWYPKEDGYIRGVYMYAEQSIEIDSIMISKDSATVIFNYGVRRVSMDAMEFRRKFER